MTDRLGAAAAAAVAAAAATVVITMLSVSAFPLPPEQRTHLKPTLLKFLDSQYLKYVAFVTEAVISSAVYNFFTLFYAYSFVIWKLPTLVFIKIHIKLAQEMLASLLEQC